MSVTFGCIAEMEISGKTIPFFLELKEPSNLLLATYPHAKNESEKIDLSYLIERISSVKGPKLEIDLKNIVLLVGRQSDSSAKFLFGLELGATINLSNLPLVGKTFPKDLTVSVDDLQLLIAKGDFTQKETQTINTLLANDKITLPEIAIKSGPHLSAKLNLGGMTNALSLPMSSQEPDAKPGPLPTSGDQPVSDKDKALPSADGAKWFKVDKTLGPVHFGRVGFKYQKTDLWILLDASLSVAGLTLSVDGLSVGSSLTEFKPEFNIHGLGVDFKKGPVEIGGAFLKQTGREEYDGTVVIKAETFNISAIGSYAELNGHKSLFVYAFLDLPLGGPAFFFITGLAFGFGYNRSFKVPHIEQVADFPLVKEVMAPSNGSKTTNGSETTDLATEIQKLSQFIPPDIGEDFIAVGVRFTSFELFDSFALLAVSFGQHFEIDVLGITTLLVPPDDPAPPLAELQLALKAVFDPEDGFLGIRAQLTSNSYILSKACHLTGGFAFYSWFNGEHNGDFVITVGGYHPHFPVPSYYPKVPRLGFNWQLDSHLSLKGGAYFALTAHAFMAGGFFDASYHSGSIGAWFKLSADFLIIWKPYHYEADIYVNIAAHASFVHVDLGASLNVWGPPFGGKAKCHIHIIFFSISFTIYFGNQSHSLPPISWEEFKSSFLPKKICHISVKSGLIKTVKDNTNSERWIINPREFVVMTHSVIPSTEANKGSSSTPLSLTNPDTSTSATTTFGIAPMNLSSGILTVITNITITRDKHNAEDDFKYIPVLKKVPTALWGDSMQPELTGKRFIENALTGFEIRPAKLPKPGETHQIERNNLKYETFNKNKKGSLLYNTWDTFKSTSIQTKNIEQRKKEIIDTIEKATTTRNSLLEAFVGIETKEINITEDAINEFLFMPEIEQQAA